MDTQFQENIKNLTEDKKQGIKNLETSILIEVKQRMIAEKNRALDIFCSGLMKKTQPNDSDKQVDTLTVDVELIVDPQEDFHDPMICTICQDIVVKPVRLPCNHHYCFDCMRAYVQDKVDMVLMKKRDIENLVIYCPNCKNPYLYLDEFDTWLYQNGFDTNEMWKIINH